MVILPEKVEQGNGNSQQISATSGSVHIADVSGGSRRRQKANQQSVISKVADLCVPMASSATYADIAAGRTSPCPFVEQVEEKDDNMKHLPGKTVITRTVMEIKDIPKQDRMLEISDEINLEDVSQKDDELKSLKVQDFKTPVKSSEKVQDMGASLIKSTISLLSEEVQSVDPQVVSIVSRGEKSRPSRRGRSQQRKDGLERKNTDKLHAQNPKTQSDTLPSLSVKPEVHNVEIISCEEAQSQNAATTKLTTSEHASVHKKHHHIVLKQPQETLKPQVRRGRSPSPMWNPGSTSYADILRGRQVSEGHEETVAVTDLHEVNPPVTEKIEVNGKKVQECYTDKYHYQQEDWNVPDSHEAVASFQQTEEVYVSAADESTVQNVENYDINQTSVIRDVVEKIAPKEVVDTGTFLQEEVIPSVHEHDVSGVAVPAGMFEYIQQPTPDLVGFIASGQQLLNSGLGTYHTSAHQYVMSHDGDQSLVYPVTVTAAQEPGNQYETLSLDSSQYVQPSVESVAYTTPIHQDFVPQQYDLPQQAVLSDQDVTSSPEVTPIHDTRHSKKVRTGHHIQTDMTAVISTAVAHEEIKPATIHQIESDHQTGSTDNVQTEGDKCQLSYAQILAQGLCAKPLQPSSQAVNLHVNLNDRSQSPRPTSPISSYSREWSASPSRDILSTVREEVTKCVVTADTKNVPKLENRAVKKKKDKMKKEADGLTHVSSPPSGDQQKHKSGKSKQKKKQAVPAILESYGKQPIDENKEEHTPVAKTEAAAVVSSGELLTFTSVADNSLASVKDRKGGCKKSKPSDDGKQQNIDSKPVSQISLQSDITNETVATEATIPEQLQIIDDKQGALTDQEKKKRQKKKKKHTDEDEIEKALKEIARMEMVFSKHKVKNIELTQEAKIDLTKQEKEDKKSKKIKTVVRTDNANAIIHKAEPKQMATVFSSVETAAVIKCTDSQESVPKLQEKQNKNSEVLNGVASEQGNENIEVPKIEQARKKKKRGKKPTGNNISGTKHPKEEPKPQSNYRGETINTEYELNGIQSGQDVSIAQTLEPSPKKQYGVTGAIDLGETEPINLEQEISEHLQEESNRVGNESTSSPQLECIENQIEESYIHPPDLLADIKHETEFLKNSKLVTGVDSAFPVDADCKQMDIDLNVTNKTKELEEKPSPVLSKRKRCNKKHKNAAHLSKEDVTKSDATSVMLKKSDSTIQSVPMEEQLALEIKSSHLAPVIIEGETCDSQKDKLLEQVKKANEPEVEAHSSVKRKKSRRGAKRRITKQCESSQDPKQEPVGSSLTSEQGKLGKGDDTANDISIKKSTGFTDLSSKETFLSTKLNVIQDRDVSKSKRTSKKSRKGKQPNGQDKFKPVIEKQHSVEKELEKNDHDELNDKEVLQEISHKSAELMRSTPKPLGMPASGLAVGNTDSANVKVVTADATMKGGSKKPKKSKSTAVKDIKEQSKGREDVVQDQAVDICLKGAEKVTKTDRAESEQPTNKEKQSSRKPKNHKEATFEQNKSNMPAVDATIGTNGYKGPEELKQTSSEIVMDNIIHSPKGTVTNADNVSDFKQLEHPVTKSRKSNKKSKKSKCGGPEDERDEHLSGHGNESKEPNVLAIKSEDNPPLLVRKSEPEDKIYESFGNQVSVISKVIKEQDTYQCIKLDANTDNIQAHIGIATSPEEDKACDETNMKFERSKDVEYASLLEKSVPEFEVHDSSKENLHEQDKKALTFTSAQKELIDVRDENLENERDEADYKSKHEHEVHNKGVTSLESQKNYGTSVTSVSDQKDLVHKTNEVQERKRDDWSSPEENVSLDAVPKLENHDTEKTVRHTTYVQPVDLQVNVPPKNDHETGDVGSTLPLPHSSPKSKKQISGTLTVPHGTSHITENTEAVVVTPQWMAESSVLQIPSEDGITQKQLVIFDSPYPSGSDTSHVVQDTNQNQGDDSPLAPSSVSLSHPQVTVPLSPASLSSDSGLAQKIVKPQEKDIDLELPGVENAGIFGSVKARTRKPRKIIDTMAVGETAAKSIEIPTLSTPEKKTKPDKSAVKEEIRKRDRKAKMAEDPKDLEGHEEYRVMKDKMRKKKRRPKIPAEFLSPRTKLENDEEAVKALDMDVETVSKDKLDEIVETEPEAVSLATKVDSFELQDVITSDFKIESSLASAYFQPVSPATVVIEEQVERETPCVIGDSSLPNSEMEPTLLETTPITELKEEHSTPLRLSDVCSTEIKLVSQEAELEDIPQEPVTPLPSCLTKSDELSSAWMSALDEPLVFDSDNEGKDGNTLTSSPSTRNIETDDALVKIQEAVIAAVESVCDVLSEPGMQTETIPNVENYVLTDSDLQAGTILVANDMLSEAGVKAKMAPTVASDVLSECSLKNEIVTTVSNDVLPESGLKNATIPTVTNDVFSETDMRTETVNTVSNDVLYEPSVKTGTVTTLADDVISETHLKIEQIATFANDMLSESGLKTDTITTLSDDMPSELGMKTEPIIAFVNDLLSESGLKTGTVTAVSDDMPSEPGMKTETVTTVSDDMPSEPGMKTETVTTVSNDMPSESGLKTETVITVSDDMPSEPGMKTEIVTTVSDDMPSEPGLKIETVTTVSDDMPSEPGMKTETVTTVSDDMPSEPGQKTEPVTTVVKDVLSEPTIVSVKPLVQTNESLLDNPDMTVGFEISPLSDDLIALNTEKKSVVLAADQFSDAWLDALEEPMVFEDDDVPVQGFDTETKMFETFLQKQYLPSEERLENLEIPVVELATGDVYGNPFTAEFIVQEIRPSYYMYRDAEMHWQEKVAQEMKKVPFTLPESEEKQGLRYLLEKPSVSKELPVTIKEQPKLESQSDQSPRNRHIFEVPTYDTHIFLDAERRWHELKTLALLRDQQMILETPEDTENKVIEVTEEHHVEMEVTNPDSLIHSVKEATLSENFMNISTKFEEETEILGSNSTLVDSRPQISSSENIAEVTEIVEEQSADTISPALGLQGNSALVEDKATELSVLDRHKSHLKHDENTGFSIGPEIEREPLVNLYKGNVWLESSKFLDAERKWRELHSELLPKEFVHEEVVAGIGTVDIVNSQELVIGEDISSGELLKQQQLADSMPSLQDTSQELELKSCSKLYKESTESIPSSQFAFQEPELKSCPELPKDSTDDIHTPQVMFQDQELKSCSKLPKDSTDDIQTTQAVFQEPEPKLLSSELPKDSTYDIHTTEGVFQEPELKLLSSELPKDSTDDIHTTQVVLQEPELKLLSSELPKDLKDDIYKTQVVFQDQELKSLSSELTKKTTDIIFSSQVASQKLELNSSSDQTKDDEVQLVLHQDHSAEMLYCYYDILGIHNAEKQHQEQVALFKPVEDKAGIFPDITTSKEASVLEKGVQDHTQVQQKETIQGGSRVHSTEISYCRYDMFGLRDAEKVHQEQVTLSISTETKPDALTNVVIPVVANHLENLDTEVSNCQEQDKIILQSESPSGTVKTWASVVASKKPDSLQGTSYEEKPLDDKEAVVSKLSNLQEPSQPSVHICVVEVENEDTNVPLVEVDPEGFMEFVPKREMRKRKSRSRSRSRCRDSVAPGKPQEEEEEEVTVASAQRKENDSVRKLPMSSVISEFPREFPIPDAVDTSTNETPTDVELYTAGEHESSFIITHTKFGKEVQKSLKPEKDEGKKEKKRHETRGKSPAQKIPHESKRKKPLSKSEQEVEGIVRSLVREEVLQRYLPLDGAFWPDKWRCHDAECQWQEIIAQSQKKPVSATASIEVKSDRTHDRNDDSDGGNSGHSSPGPHTPMGGGSGGEGGGGLGSSGVTTEQLSADLPGGICSWPDESTYLAGSDILVVYPNRQNTTEDEELLAAEEEHASLLAHRVAEEVFTDLDDEQEPEFIFCPPSSTTEEVHPSYIQDDNTAIFVVQMKVGDL
jgi:hypothetical protein